MDFKVKILACLMVLYPFWIFSQQKTEWQHLDPEKDNVLGISTLKAYELLKNRQSKPVVVAVIDNGAELIHEDLHDQFWINPNEIPSNGIDDDGNGYIDDIHGWNFLGNAKGQNIKRETTELTRIYGELKKKFNQKDLKPHDSSDLAEFLKIKGLYEIEIKRKNREIHAYRDFLNRCKASDSILRLHFLTKNYTQLDLFQLKDTSKNILAARNTLLDMHAMDMDTSKLKSHIKNNQDDLETRLNPEFDIRQQIIGDNTSDMNDSIYGNNMVDAQSPYHGTGVAGTIGALWNEKGVSGVAKNVKLMILRVLPNGDERDKDVALAIRYAIRNKADIINCSFGKSYSSNPEFVQQVIKEAENEGILIVHAAGNDGRNSDSIPTYPTGVYPDGRRSENWISVGASKPEDSKGLVAYFSNYGKKMVDLFAPGWEVPSCALGNKYDLASGTSTAAPIVSGIAAVLKSYFPHLKAVDLKKIIMQSVYIPKTNLVNLPGRGFKSANFKDLSVSGGIANLYKAVELALSGKYK